MEELIKAVILGIIQGITEFLPVSSTAHLVITPWLFGWHGSLNSLSFDIAVHVGTLFSLLFCFWKDWIEIFFRDRKTLFLLIIGSIPAGVAGFAFHDLIETSLRNPLIIVFTLIVVGILMLLAEKMSKQKRNSVTFSDALLIGTAQAMALIPGVSRSGITITAGLFNGLERAYAAKFSFLLSTPAIAGAAMLDLYKSIKTGYVHDYEIFTIGALSSAVTGFFAIKFLLSFLKKYPLNIFVYYRWLLAALILLVYFIK